MLPLISTTPVCVRQLCKSCNIWQFRAFAQLCGKLPARTVSLQLPPEIRCVVSLNARVTITCSPRRNFRYKKPSEGPEYKADQVDLSFELIYSNRKATMLKYLPAVYLIILSFIMPVMYHLLFEESKAQIDSMEEWIESYTLYAGYVCILGSIFVFFLAKRYPLRIYHHPAKNEYILIVKEYLSIGHVPFKASDVKPLALTASRWRGTTSIYGFPLFAVQNDFVNLSYSNRFIFGIEDTDGLSDDVESSVDEKVEVSQTQKNHRNEETKKRKQEGKQN